MLRLGALFILLAGLPACNSLTVAGSAEPVDGVVSTLGARITPNGVRPTGNVNIRLF